MPLEPGIYEIGNEFGVLTVAGAGQPVDVRPSEGGENSGQRWRVRHQGENFTLMNMAWSTHLGYFGEPRDGSPVGSVGPALEWRIGSTTDGQSFLQFTGESLVPLVVTARVLGEGLPNLAVLDARAGKSTQAWTFKPVE